MFTGSFIGLFKYNNDYALILLTIGIILSTIGVVKNLHKINSLEKEIEDV